jgi:hypothetical protein
LRIGDPCNGGFGLQRFGVGACLFHLEVADDGRCTGGEAKECGDGPQKGHEVHFLLLETCFFAPHAAAA